MILIMIGSSQDLNTKHMVEETTIPSPAGCREELLDHPDLTSMTAVAAVCFEEN
jgi:hypothetical protein